MNEVHEVYFEVYKKLYFYIFYIFYCPILQILQILLCQICLCDAKAFDEASPPTHGRGAHTQDRKSVV